MGIALITNNILSDSGTAVSGLVPTSRTISTTSPLTGGGDLSADRTIAIPAATSTISGYLTNVDWVTFNSKQNALVNPVTGTGTTNYLPKFTGANTLGNSIFTEDGGNTLRIIAASAAVRLDGSNDYLLQTVDADGRFRIYDQTAAIERLTLTSLGNLGIGTTSPATTVLLDLKEPDAATDLIIGLTAGTGARSQIRSIAQALGSTSELSFHTVNASSTGERMRITSGGNVLIGTTTDSGYKLNVAGEISLDSYLRHNGDTDTFFGFSNNDEIKFRTAGTDRLTIASTGAATFTAQGAAGYGTINLESEDPFIRLYDNGASSATDKKKWDIRVIGVTGAESFDIRTVNDANTVFSTKLSIAHSGAATFSSSVLANSFNIAANGTIASNAFWGTLHTKGAGSFADWALINSGGNGVMYNPTGTLNMTFAGNVGIGTTSPQQLLHISASNASMQVQSTTAGQNANVRFVTTARTWAIGPNQYLGNSSFEIVDSTAGAARVVVVPNGNVLIGSSTDIGYRLYVSGSTYVSNVLSIGSYFEGNCNFSAYTADGLFSANARPSTITTPNGGQRIRLGYFDYGGGQYYGRIGFAATTNWSLGSIGSAGNDFSIGTGASGQMLLLSSAGSATFSGSVTATSFFESSDATIKTLITDNYQAKGIESVVAKLYTKNGKEELGYYAQDVQGILPSAVSKGENGLLSLSYREVHTAKIARLEKELEELKARLN